MWGLILSVLFFLQLGNIFISRKTAVDECEDEEDGPTTSVIYKIGNYQRVKGFRFETSIEHFAWFWKWEELLSSPQKNIQWLVHDVSIFV